MIKNYYKPTPKKWRQIGDAILATGLFVTSGGLLAFDKLSEIFTPKELKVIIAVALILGAAGKFITNLFKEDSVKEDEKG